MPNITENNSIGSMTNGWQNQLQEKGNQNMITATPSAFKLANLTSTDFNKKQQPLGGIKTINIAAELGFDLGQ